MTIKKVIVIEDTPTKNADICKALKRFGVADIYSAGNAEEGIGKIEEAIQNDDPYELLVSDMQFDFYGTDDRMAGEKTLRMLREKGINIPVIFCSSQNWTIPGAAGTVFYHPDRYWEGQLEALIKKVTN